MAAVARGLTRSNNLYVKFIITFLKSISAGQDKQQIPCPACMQNVACKLMRPLLIVISFILASCSNSFNDKQIINSKQIEYADIQKQFDTVAIRLTEDQTNKLIRKWNQSSPKGPHKFFPEYLLTIHFKGDSTLSFRTSKELIKQRNDWTYSVGDTEFFQNIWLKQAGLNVDYFQYYPTYFVKDKFSKDINPLKEKHRNSIKQVLSHYKHKWTDIRGQIFYQGKIDDELIWNYTTKATDSLWLITHQ